MRGWLMLIFSALAAQPALAAASQWGGSITASSDYLVRGTSRNYNDPALAAEIHAQFRQGAFASLWASSTRLRYTDPVTAELAGTVGYAGNITDRWSWSAGITHYEAPWSSRAAEYRYNELVLDVHWRDRLLLSATWSPDTSRTAPWIGFVARRHAMAWEAEYQQEVHRHVRAYAGFGYYDLSALFGSGYWYGSAGVGVNWRRWQLDLAYVRPDGSARRVSYPDAARNRAVASLSFNF